MQGPALPFPSEWTPAHQFLGAPLPRDPSVSCVTKFPRKGRQTRSFMEVLKEIIYWVLYTLIVGGGILFFGAILVHDTIELTRDVFGRRNNTTKEKIL